MEKIKRVTLTGYLGRDRELRETAPRTRTFERYDDIVDEQVETEVTTPSTEYALLSLATAEYSRGQRKTTWHRVIAWNTDRMDKFAVRLARKGDQVRITGRLQTFTYTDAAGVSRELEQVVLDNLKFLKKRVRCELA